MINPVRWENGRLVLLDQTRLPAEEVERSCASWAEVADAIRRLVVRGAPALQWVSTRAPSGTSATP